MKPHREMVEADLPAFPITRKAKGVQYLNGACGFDIETTSIERDGEKHAFCYMWMVGIGEGEAIYYGRTLTELSFFLERVADAYELTPDYMLPVYVHNFGYEFQFIRHYFDWHSVFAVGERKPIRAVTTSGIEFRDSLILSGQSLAGTARNLTTSDVRKLTGDLDYELVRHHETPLTDQEMAYCQNDVEIVTAYIAEQIALYGDVSKIPMTNTGRVRQYVRDECHIVPGKSKRESRGKYARYRQIMSDLTIAPEQYDQLKRGFMGGFTHASNVFSGHLIEGVDSIDLSSSYPAVMVSEKFPMSRGRSVTVESLSELRQISKRNCVVFDIVFHNLNNRIGYESYLSESRCFELSGQVVDNGRIYAAVTAGTTITDVDLQIISAVYEWEGVEVSNVTAYHKGYLPKPIVKSILDLYRKKTELKGVPGYETEYLLSKGMLNSVYGMSVTDILQDSHIYTGTEWDQEETDKVAEIEDYNESRNRFLYYPWGVWVTAYARRNVWQAIINAGEDYVYCDTDSVKMLNYEKHKGFVEAYNKAITEKLETAVKYHRLDTDDLAPKNKHGERKPLGIWEHEGHYSHFKTLGAKRYMYKEGDAFNLVVAGLSKQNGMDYIHRQCQGDTGRIFAMFNPDLYIPADETGKMTHTYLDAGDVIDVQDYRGNMETVEYHSAIHLGKCEFTLSIAVQYQRFLEMLANGYMFKGVKYQ